MSIPKVIHYCWLSNDPLPDKLARCIKSWSEKCPDYEIINWNFDRLGDNCPIWVRQAFDTKKYAFAADWVRAYVLYTHGGIYLDSDVEVLKPFDDLLDNRYFLSYEHDSTETIEAAVMGAEAGLGFFKDLLSYYDGRKFIKEDGSLDTLALPRIMNKLITEKGYSILPIRDVFQMGTIELQSSTLLAVLPPDYFSPKSALDGKINRTANTYTIHHFAASWLSPSLRFKRYIKQKSPRLMECLVICKHILKKIFSSRP